MFKGAFKTKNSAGQPITYSIGDVVLYQGKLYECRIPTTKTPFQEPLTWSFTGNTEQVQSENPPLKPRSGQVWVSSNGRSYVWFEDSDGSQWIET